MRCVLSDFTLTLAQTTGTVDIICWGGGGGCADVGVPGGLKMEMLTFHSLEDSADLAAFEPSMGTSRPAFNAARVLQGTREVTCTSWVLANGL